MDYTSILVTSIIVWAYTRAISYGSIHSQVSKHKVWPLVISNIIFDIFLIVIIFDLLKNFNVFDHIVSRIRSGEEESHFDLGLLFYFLIFGIGYFLIFKISSIFRHSSQNIYPQIKQFLRNRRLLYILINTILFALYFSILFALAHYLIYVISSYAGYSSPNLTFIDFIYYSLTVLFASPISYLKPTSQISIIVTLIESIFSYFLLVIFVAFIFESYSKSKLTIYKKRKVSEKPRRNALFRKKYLRKRFNIRPK